MDVVEAAASILLLAGFVASLSLAVPGAVGLRDRASWPFWGMAGVLLLGLAWLAVSAGQDDDHFSPESVSRWEFADRNGTTWLVIAGAIAGAIAVAFLALGARSPLGCRRRRVAMALSAVGFLGIGVAWLAMTVGH